MKTSHAVRLVLTLIAPIFFSTLIPSNARADAIVVLPDVPVISIKATTPETREPFCDPAICDAAPPPPGIFTVSRTGGDSSRELTVFLSYEGSAANGVDYAKLPETVQFPSGVDSVELYVEATFDQIPEGDEVAVARLQPDPSVGPIERYRLDPLQSAARMLIRDNEAPIEPVVSITATSPIAEETSFPYRRIAFRGVFTISRTGPTNDSLRVFVHYSGTATPGVDFPALPWLVTIPAGVSQVELEVVPTMDGTVEPIEILDATLSECPPLTDPPMGIPCYAVNIDPAHATARVFLRDDGITTSTLELTAPRDGDTFPPGRAIRLAATAIDLDGAITYVEFYDGETKVGESAIFFIRAPDPGTPIHHEFNWEGASPGKHQLTVRAVSSSGEKVTSPPVTIQVSEGLPVVSIEATVPETTEPSPTTRIRPGAFTLRRTGEASAPLRVWVHFGGTATPDLDYVALPNVVEFPAGASSVELLVAPLDDTLIESDESVVVELGLSPLAVIPNYDVDPVRRRAVVIIHDNGTALPVVSIRATRPITSEPCPFCLVAPGVFTVSRTGGTGAPLGVWYRLGGTAKNGEDYARLSGYVTIPEGRESVEILVLGTMDNIPEGDETVVATLTIPDIVIAIYPPPPPPYQIDLANASATVTIRDFPVTPSTPMVSIVATDPFAREGASAAGIRNNAAFTVTRTGETTDALEVRFELGGTAQAGVDYRVTESPLIILAGQRRAQIIVSPIDDSLVEGIETVVVGLGQDLTSPPRYTVGSPRRAAAIIVDNDRVRPPCVRLPGGLFNLCVPSGTNDCYRIDATRDFKEWTPLAIVPVNEERVHFIDPEAPAFGDRFYRIVPVPCE